MTTIKRRAFSYVRFSSGRQAEGTSRERQESDAERTCRIHGWTLDNSMTISDYGKSAFKGDLPGMQGFRRAIKDGLVQPGDVLIVEKLDRMSREGISRGRKLIEEILEAGIWIAISSEDGKIYKPEDLDSPWIALEIAMKLYVAWEESKKKSDRQTRNWEFKRRDPQARFIAPAWVVWDKRQKKYILDEEKAETIRQIYRMSIDGMGGRQIFQRLVADGVPCITDDYTYFGKNMPKKGWKTWYVSDLLRDEDKRLLGDMQFYLPDESGKYRTKAEVIPNYFPRVMPEKLYYAQKAARESRKGQRGPRGKKTTNLFTGLVWDTHTGNSMTVGRGYLACHNHVVIGRGWEYHVFEAAMLKELWELSAELGRPREKADPLPGLKAKLKGITAQIEGIGEEIASGRGFEAYRTVLGKLSAAQEETAQQIEDAQQAAATAKQATGAAFADAAQMLANAGEDEIVDLRTRIKGLIRLLVDRIDVTIEAIEGNKLRRTLQVRITLKNGNTWVFGMKVSMVRKAGENGLRYEHEAGRWLVKSSKGAGKSDLIRLVAKPK